MAEKTKERYINPYTDLDFDKLIGSDLKLDKMRVGVVKNTPPIAYVTPCNILPAAAS